MNNNRYLIILLLALLILVVVYFLTKLYNKVEQFHGVEETLRKITINNKNKVNILNDNDIVVGIINIPKIYGPIAFRISDDRQKLEVTTKPSKSVKVTLISFKKKKGHTYTTRFITVGSSRQNTKRISLGKDSIRNKIYFPYSKVYNTKWPAIFKVNVNNSTSGNNTLTITRIDKNSGWGQDLEITEITETPIETSTETPIETPTSAPVSVGSNNISNKLNTLSDKINTISDKINTIADHSTVQIISKSTTDMMSYIESIINNASGE